MDIAIVYPDAEIEGSFYAAFVTMMQAVARKLGIGFEAIRCDPIREELVDRGHALLSRSQKLDYLVINNSRGAGKTLMKIAHEANVKVFVTPEGFSRVEQVSVGDPGQKYPNWIGQLLPDEYQAGHLLATTLLDQAVTRGMTARDGKLHVIGLGGNLTHAATARATGLRDAIAKHPGKVRLDELILANWEEERATRMAADALRRFPDTAVIWAANDQMALGALTAVQGAGKHPGKDVLIGGMDWLPRALRAVQHGELFTTVGGHIVAGAWAVILMYDHSHNFPFPRSSMNIEWTAATSANAGAFSRLFDPGKFSRIEFARFCRAKDPQRQEYELSAMAFLPYL